MSPTFRSSADAGVSLVELLVTMAVSTVLLLAVAVTFTSTTKISRGVTARTNATADARLAMDTVVRRLRVAVRPPGEDAMLVLAAADRLSFYASTTKETAINRFTVPPTKVDYYVDADRGCFVEALTPGVQVGDEYTWAAGDMKDRCLTFGVLNGPGAALFTYYEAASAASSLSTVSGQLPPASLDLVRSVGLSMDVRDKLTSTTGAVQVQTKVTLVNRLGEDLYGRSG